MLLAEDLLLLAHKDQAGVSYLLAEDRLDDALHAAVLIDLILLNALHYHDQVLVPTTGTIPEDAVLNAALLMLRKATAPVTLMRGIRLLCSQHPRFRYELLERLAERGILRKQEERLLLVFTQATYLLQDEKYKAELVAHLGRVLIQRARPDIRTTMLVQLATWCRLIDFIFRDVEEATRAKLAVAALADHDMQRLRSEPNSAVPDSHVQCLRLVAHLTH
jgi:hypothetical protein